MGVSMIEHDDMMNRKTVSISQKRQITIPKKFFTKLGFGEEAECFLRGNELVIRPVSPYYGGEFSEQILEDLILQGYEGCLLYTSLAVSSLSMFSSSMVFTAFKSFSNLVNAFL